MDIVHMHFEVVVPCKLLMAKLAFCQGTIGVMSHLVSDQHFLQTKSQVTNITLERLFPGVRSRVLVQAPLLAEGFAALGALVWLLPGVSPDVHFQSIIFAEPLFAVGTLVGTLTCVAADVDSQRPAAGEFLATIGADFLLFSCMRLLMTSEHRRRHEGLVAQLTPVFLVSLMDHLDMNIQGVLPFKGGITMVTLKGPFTVVYEQVSLQRKRGPEQSLTLLTLEGPLF